MTEIRNPKLSTLMKGLAFGESLRWHSGQLWVSDWGTQEIIAIDCDGKQDVKVKLNFQSCQPICMDWLPDGRMVIVSSADGKLLCQNEDGSLRVYADLRPFTAKGWNEIVIDNRGNAFVNGGGFNPMSGEKFAPGIIVLVTFDGAVRQVADGIAFPNGMAITPDDSTLIIAESYGKRLTALDIAADGGLSNRRIWADLGDGVPDGIRIDAEGAIWYADVPNKNCVRVHEGGDKLQRVELDHGAFDCVLGGEQGKTLFIVSREWLGMQKIDAKNRTGQILVTEAPAAAAGWPLN